MQTLNTSGTPAEQENLVNVPNLPNISDNHCPIEKRYPSQY